MDGAVIARDTSFQCVPLGSQKPESSWRTEASLGLREFDAWTPLGGCDRVSLNNHGLVGGVNSDRLLMHLDV